MNIEEAAEEILKGAFIDCKLCDATGYYTTAHLQIHDELEMEMCVRCRGNGRKHRTNYLTACNVLGMEAAPLFRIVDTWNQEKRGT